MMACGDRTNNNDMTARNLLNDEDLTSEEIKSYYDNMCLRWYQLAAYMPALHTEYGHGKYNKLPTTNTNYKWIQHSLDRRMVVSVTYVLVVNIEIFSSLN